MPAGVSGERSEKTLPTGRLHNTGNPKTRYIRHSYGRSASDSEESIPSWISAVKTANTMTQKTWGTRVWRQRRFTTEWQRWLGASPVHDDVAAMSQKPMAMFGDLAIAFIMFLLTWCPNDCKVGPCSDCFDLDGSSAICRGWHLSAWTGISVTATCITSACVSGTAWRTSMCQRRVSSRS